MGGRAFLQPGPNGEAPLNVPRMDQKVYETMKFAMQHKLEMMYMRTAVPLDAPGKKDFGDIDFIVEGQLTPITPKEVAEKLEAVRFIVNGDDCSYAIKHPALPDSYIQVDVKEIDHKVWDWMLFIKAHSDFLQILAVIHRHLGLTFNETGMYLRIQEIEPINKKLSMLKLTDDPSEVLVFLGLGPKQYDSGFATEDELFLWISKCRFFNPELLKTRIETSNDRQRIEKRPMFRRFFLEWLVAHPNAGSKRIFRDRKQVLDLALSYFNKMEEYNIKVANHKAAMREVNLWKTIAERIPAEGKTARRVAVRGLKFWVEMEEGKPKFRNEPDVVADGAPTWARMICYDDSLFGPDDKLLEDVEDVKVALDWLKDNWEKARDLEKRRSTAANEALASKTAN